jgi:hypothetical protein
MHRVGHAKTIRAIKPPSGRIVAPPILYEIRCPEAGTGAKCGYRLIKSPVKGTIGRGARDTPTGAVLSIETLS